jgi:hypothetical protein
MRTPFHSTRGAFGQDGNAALTLLVVGVHGAFGHLLVLANRAGLLEKLVNQGRLAMVDMGDDGDIANFHGDQNHKSGRARSCGL